LTSSVLERKYALVGLLPGILAAVLLLVPA
jgi:hypothetical protein